MPTRQAVVWLVAVATAAAVVALRVAPCDGQDDNGDGDSKPVYVAHNEFEYQALLSHNAAVAHHRAGRIAEAIAAYERATSLMPELADSHLNLGELLSTTNRVDDAIAHLEAAARVARASGKVHVCAGALNNLGLYYARRAGRDPVAMEDAVPYYEEAMRVAPTLVDPVYNYGRLRHAQGRSNDAIRLFAKVLQLEPNHAGATVSTGNVWMDMLRYEKAVEYYRIAATLKSADPGDQPAAMHNLAQALKAAGDIDEAIEVLTDLVSSSDPTDTMHVATLQSALRAACDWSQPEAVDLALQQFESTVRLHEKLMGLNKATAEEEEEEEEGEGENGVDKDTAAGDDALAAMGYRDSTDVEALSTRVSCITVYDSMLLPVSPHMMLRLGTVISRQQASPTVAYHPQVADDGPQQRRREWRLRVGYASYDFRKHPMGFLTYGLMLYHNRDAVSVHCYHYGPGALSDPGSTNITMTSRISQACDSFTLAMPLSAGDVAQRIAAERVHILVDLMGHTTGARLAIPALKPAPLVVNYLGCPCTSGAATTDYAIVDRVVAMLESSARGFSEALAVMPHSYQANKYEATVPLCADLDGACVLAARAKYGLPTDAGVVVLANFNTHDKLEPASFGVWMNILHRAPNAVLWLLEPKAPSTQARLQAEAVSRGIALSRIIWAPRMPRLEHLARYQAVDLFVDTNLYTAHSTASDALWGGTPLLTITSPRFPGLVAASLLRAMQAAWLVAHTFKEFEDLAVRLVQHRRGLLWRMRAHLAAMTQQTPTFDSRGMTRLLERAYHAMWECHLERRSEEHRDTAAVGGVPGEDTPRLHEVRLPHVVVHPHHRRQFGQLEGTHPAVTRRLDHMIRTGMRVHESGDVDVARDVYKRVLATDGEHPDALHFQGVVKHMKGDHRGAVTDIRRALQLAQGRPGYNFLDPFRSNLNTAVAAGIQQLTQQEAVTPLSPKDSFLLGHYMEMAGEPAAQSVMLEAVRREHTQDWETVGRHVAKVPRPEGRLSVAVYCYEYGQTWWPHWGPRSVEEGGAGGSEEAVILLTQELAKLGMHVEVYTDVEARDIGVAPSGVVWYPYQAYDMSKPADVFIAWRYSISAALAVGSAASFVWLHDRVDLPKLFVPEVSRLVTGVMFLSKYHARGMPQHVLDKVVLTRNGLQEDYFVSGANDPLRFIYASAPGRGLEQLLLMWPSIRDGLAAASHTAGRPAELFVYYGFTPAFERHMTQRLGSSRYAAWRQKMMDLLRAEGVRYIGLVPPRALANAYAASGFALYPTSFGETSCVAMMKAMALGAIPITSRYPDSALPELTDPFDLGPQPPPRRLVRPASATGGDESLDTEAGAEFATIASDPEWLLQWRDAVVEAASRAVAEQHADVSGQGSIVAHRGAMMAWARHRLPWSAVAEEWAQLFSRSTRGD